MSGDELDLDGIEALAITAPSGSRCVCSWQMAQARYIAQVGPYVPALVAEVRRLRALLPAPDPGDLDCRTCGHRRRDHIYEEGACRPGYPCAGSCAVYVPDVK